MSKCSHKEFRSAAVQTVYYRVVRLLCRVFDSVACPDIRPLEAPGGGTTGGFAHERFVDHRRPCDSSILARDGLDTNVGTLLGGLSVGKAALRIACNGSALAENVNSRPTQISIRHRYKMTAEPGEEFVRLMAAFEEAVLREN